MQTDTEKLLKECDAGIKMGVKSLKDIEENIKNNRFKTLVSNCRQEHEKFEGEAAALLKERGLSGKKPSRIALCMSQMKAGVKIVTGGRDNDMASLVTDGCHMGIKSLCSYLNEYKNADEEIKELAKSIIKSEEDLTSDIKIYL